MAETTERNKRSGLRWLLRLFKIMRVLARHKILGALFGRRHWPTPRNVSMTLRHPGTLIYCVAGGFTGRLFLLRWWWVSPIGCRHRRQLWSLVLEPVWIGQECAVEDGRVYRAAMLGEQGVPKKYGSHRRKIDMRVIAALQRLFSRTGQVRRNRRGCVVAI